MLHFQRLDVYQRSIEFLDVMRSDDMIEPEHYERGLELLERIVAMLTKLIDP